MKRFFNLLVWSIVLSASALAQTADPRIIFSDLQSGPNSGGANNKGSVVTIYGFGFGATRGTSSITIGGAGADNYLQWSDTKVSFQLGNAAVTGNIVANVSGVASNGMPFTVRPGKLYFVSPTGADSNAGTFTAPWHSVVKAKNTAVAGDVIYLMNGVNQTALESSSASLALAKSGTASLPIALVAYPGATATIGSATGQSYGIRTTAAANYWLLAGLTLRGSFSALNVANSSNWRVVGSDISCPNASGSGACVDFAGATNISMYRNTIHDVAPTTGGTNLKLYQGVLFETGSTAIDFGWNEIANVRSCRGLQFSSDASPLYNITVRNNLIHDTRCDGINFASVEPSLGAVNAYNNVIYRAGTGPAPNGIESNYACINVGAAGTSPVLVQDNTLYDCGRRANGDSGAISAAASVLVVNNIIYSLTGESYLAPNSLSTRFSGTNNLFFGAGTTPAFSTTSMNANPNFTSAASNNFRPLAGSPAIDRGMSTGINRDIVQGLRPSGTAYDIGAYEYVSGSTTPPPPQPGTLTMSATSLAFGSVNTGSSANQSLTLSNNSTAAVSVSALAVTGTGFTRSTVTLPLTLQPGQSSVLTLTFAPQAAGAVSGSLSIASNATNSSVTVALTGTGTTPVTPPSQGTLTVSATSLAFGSVVDGSSLAKAVTLSNSSSASVTVSAIAATGTGFTEINPALPLTLAAGKTATVTVTFAPTAAGSDTGNLQITSNATDASVAVTLSGTGTAPTQHSVDVAWGAATPVPAGYNVYRATQSAGPFSKVNASLINALIFTDSTVTPGATYFYIVTSVGADGTESTFSNQATAVVPNP